MSVKRIVANIKTDNIASAKEFYEDILGLSKIMDHGWIATYGNENLIPTQISFATEGGNGTLVPDISIEVDNVDEVYERMQSSPYDIEYPLSLEEWGVKRFFVRDPFGKLINILAHV